MTLRTTSRQEKAILLLIGLLVVGVAALIASSFPEDDPGETLSTVAEGAEVPISAAASDEVAVATPLTTTTSTTTTTVPPTTTTVPPTTTTAPPATTVPPTTTTAPPTTTTAPPAPATTAPPVAAHNPGGDCSGWATLVAAHFPGQEATACRVLACESGGNPNAVSHTNDHGLFQIHAGSSRWPGGHQSSFTRVTGKPFFDGVYDPNANAQFAAWLARTGGWGHWYCY